MTSGQSCVLEIPGASLDLVRVPSVTFCWDAQERATYFRRRRPVGPNTRHDRLDLVRLFWDPRLSDTSVAGLPVPPAMILAAGNPLDPVGTWRRLATPIPLQYQRTVLSEGPQCIPINQTVCANLPFSHLLAKRRCGSSHRRPVTLRCENLEGRLMLAGLTASAGALTVMDFVPENSVADSSPAVIAEDVNTNNDVCCSAINESPAVKDLAAGTTMVTLQQEIDGVMVSRSFIIHVPDNLEAGNSYPVVFAFHGNGGVADRWTTTFGDMVNDEEFFGVYPQGYLNSWNLGSEHSTADDVEFSGVHYKMVGHGHGGFNDNEGGIHELVWKFFDSQLDKTLNEPTPTHPGDVIPPPNRRPKGPGGENSSARKETGHPGAENKGTHRSHGTPHWGSLGYPFSLRSSWQTQPRPNNRTADEAGVSTDQILKKQSTTGRRENFQQPGNASSQEVFGRDVHSSRHHGQAFSKMVGVENVRIHGTSRADSFTKFRKAMFATVV